MTPLPAPLLLLIGLQLRAGVRRRLRALRRPKGAAAFLASVALLLLWLVPSLFVPSGHSVAAAPEDTASAPSDLGPFVVLGLLLLSIIGTPADRALVFSRAEVDFLFTAPFSRRQLLVFNLARRFVPLLVLSLFFGLVGRRFANSLSGAIIGSLLLFWFLNLATLCAALAGELLGEHRFRVARRFLIGGAVVATGAGSWWLSSRETMQPIEAFRAFTASWLGQAMALPATPFARTLAAPDLASALLPWGLVALSINVVLLALAIRLDANWLEASSESSRRLHERLQRVRRGGSAAAAPARFAGVRVPMPPRLGGIGPLAWRQMVGAVRGGGRSMWVFLVMLGVALIPMFIAGPGRESVMAGLRPVSVFMLGYITLFAPQILRLDFRGDIDRLDLLKALPVSARRLAIAQVGVAAGVVTAIQWILAIPLGYIFDWHVDALPLWALVALGANLYNVGLDNVCFLMWPQRHQHAPGMNLASGQMLTQMLKILVFVAGLALAAGAAVAAALVLPGASGIWLAAAVALIVLAIESAVTVLLVATLFRRFDPALERVPE